MNIYDDVFHLNPLFIRNMFSGCAIDPVEYGYYGHFENDGSDLPSHGTEMKITAILKPKEGINYGCLNTGFVLSSAFDETFIRDNKDSGVSTYLKGIKNIFDTYSDEQQSDLIEELKTKETALAENPLLSPEMKAALKTMLQSSTLISLCYYDYSDNFDTSALDFVEEGVTIPTFSTPISIGTVGENVQTMSILQNLMGSFDLPSQIKSALRSIGGEEVSNNVSIFPKSFDDKHFVTDYLDAWNGDDPITIYPNGVEKTIQRANRSNVKYTDNLEIIINMINSLIDIISIALIAFTSLSLVVSTVMIGIITYVSVVERVKEIGIIRSLGGRKLDVSNLFIVETFIIGAISGLFGLAVTYIISVIINIVLAAVAGVGAIVWLPWYLALVVLALSIGLTLISGLIPSRAAAKKDPVVALRSGE